MFMFLIIVSCTYKADYHFHCLFLYKIIPCSHCDGLYIGRPKRYLETRVLEHRKDSRTTNSTQDQTNTNSLTSK